MQRVAKVPRREAGGSPAGSQGGLREDRVSAKGDEKEGEGHPRQRDLAGLENLGDCGYCAGLGARTSSEWEVQIPH